MSSGSVTVFIAACFGTALIVRDRNRRKARDDIISLQFALNSRSDRMTEQQIAEIHSAIEQQERYLSSWRLFRPRINWIDLDIPGFQAHLWPVGSRN